MTKRNNLWIGSDKFEQAKQLSKANGLTVAAYVSELIENQANKAGIGNPDIQIEHRNPSPSMLGQHWIECTLFGDYECRMTAKRAQAFSRGLIEAIREPNVVFGDPCHRFIRRGTAVVFTDEDGEQRSFSVILANELAKAIVAAGTAVQARNVRDGLMPAGKP